MESTTKKYVMSSEQLELIKGLDKELKEITSKAQQVIDIVNLKKKAFTDVIKLLCVTTGFHIESVLVNLDTGELSEEVYSVEKPDA